MQRSILWFAFALAASAGCATASDDGTSPGTTHDSGARGGGDTAVATDSGAREDTASAPSDDVGAPSDTSTTPLDTGAPVDDAGPTPTDPSCAAVATNNDCQTCCYTAHTDAYNAFAGALSSCACKPGNCASECAATACASPPASADATCIACLKKVQTGACKADIDAVCGSPTGACYPFAPA